MRVLGVFAGVIGAFSCALAWLGWQFLNNDRSIEDHRIQQELAGAAIEVTANLQQRLDLAQPGVVRLTISEDHVDAQPPDALSYYPVLPEIAQNASDFAAGETAEFRDHRLADAATSYFRLAKSSRRTVRAGALARLGRVLRLEGRTQDALAAFDQLADLGDVRVDQLPAGLVAQEARCRLFESLGRRTELQHAAVVLRAGLQSNRWALLRPSREFYTSEAAHWGASLPLDEHEKNARALAAAAEWLYNHSDAASPVIVQSAEGPVLASWDFAGEQLHATLAAPSYLAAALRSHDPLVECGLIDRNGKVLAGAVQSRGPRELRPSYANGLAWDLAATLRDPDLDLANYAARRRLLVFGFGVVALVLAAGTYYILRSLAHEQAVARLQSRFVATVSHELRTPLSSIVQISEMLAADRIPRTETAPAFAHLVEESSRLQKLVESLLDFRTHGVAVVSLPVRDVGCRRPGARHCVRIPAHHGGRGAQHHGGNRDAAPRASRRPGRSHGGHLEPAG